MNLQKYLDQLYIDITSAIKNGTSIGIEGNINTLKEGSKWEEEPSSRQIIRSIKNTPRNLSYFFSISITSS